MPRWVVTKLGDALNGRVAVEHVDRFPELLEGLHERIVVAEIDGEVRATDFPGRVIRAGAIVERRDRQIGFETQHRFIESRYTRQTQEHDNKTFRASFSTSSSASRTLSGKASRSSVRMRGVRLPSGRWS